MNFGFRSPYGFVRDEMERIPFKGKSWEAWMRSDNQKRKGFLFHFMIWSHLLLASAFLAVPFYLATKMGLMLTVPLITAVVAFALFATYKNLGKA